MSEMKTLPFKSVAAALLFCVFLGPLGLLYASFWGGFFMTMIGMVVVRAHMIFPIMLLWVVCSIWGVGAVEQYNRRILQLAQK